MSSTEGREPAREPELELSAGAPRAWRGLAVITFSLVVIGATAAAYLRPSFGASRMPAAPSVRHAVATAAYQPGAIDFVGPNTGWVVAMFSSGAYALLATSDGGNAWAKQLSGVADGRTAYLHFFDAKNGVFALVGVQSVMYRTSDGGRTWSLPGPFRLPPNVMSLSFVDPRHGWMLVGSGADGAGPELMRTDDGAASWAPLGLAVATGDQAFRVQFASPQTGWLDSLNAGPYAYRTDNGGQTWEQVPLPAPAGGWPEAGQFLVATHPTKGLGVLTSVINFLPNVGRSGVGGSVVAYPPLTVGTFDGGGAVKYIYTTMIDNVSGAGAAQPQQWVNSASQVEAPGQVDLGSLDAGRSWSRVAFPADAGAIGYADAADWWWVGSGLSSTSSDGGKTWAAPKHVGVLAPLPATLQLLDRQTAWFGAMAGTRPVLETTDDSGLHWRMVLMPAIAL